jgi:hypothetical protein
MSIQAANARALEQILQADPVLTDIRPAHEVISGMDRHTLLHAGPPITWPEMCGPMKGAVFAALKYEKLARNDDEAEKLADSGKITFLPCHTKQAVGPMTGVTSFSMPLYVVENRHAGNTAYSTINEGAGDVLRFGAYTEQTVTRLQWIETVLAPVLKRVIQNLEGLKLSALMAQALSMEDELHMRNLASTNLLLKAIIPTLIDVEHNHETLAQIVKFLTANNDQFFLNLAMAANKTAADAAHDIQESTLVTAIARNGVEVGIRVSGLPDAWFTAPAPPVEGLYFPGYSAADACPDLGDSAIMETVGFGGFAMAAAPAIVNFLGVPDVSAATAYTQAMYEITAGEQTRYTIPGLNFRGLPAGVDIIKVVETRIQPVINTAIAGKHAGMGMIGAGVAKVPLKVFEQALIAFDARYTGEAE